MHHDAKTCRIRPFTTPAPMHTCSLSILPERWCATCLQHMFGTYCCFSSWNWFNGKLIDGLQVIKKNWFSLHVPLSKARDTIAWRIWSTLGFDQHLTAGHAIQQHRFDDANYWGVDLHHKRCGTQWSNLWVRRILLARAVWNMTFEGNINDKLWLYNSCYITNTGSGWVGILVLVLMVLILTVLVGLFFSVACFSLVHLVYFMGPT